MKECDLWAVKKYSDPSYIFSESQDPQPQPLASTPRPHLQIRRCAINTCKVTTVSSEMSSDAINAEAGRDLS